MKKVKFFFYPISVFLITTQIVAQERNWIDGNPFFQRTSEVENVRIDSIVSLIPTSGFKEEPGSFQFILSVIDSTWIWPEQIKIFSAEDIEYYIDNNGEHYVVTDVDGRRVLDVILSSPERAWIFEGEVGTPAYLKNPVDTYVYKQNDEPIFLITDQNRHRVIKVDRYRTEILWQYGDESEGSGFNQLYYPADAVALPASGQVLICDKGNNRVILVNEADTTIAWEWGPGILNRPVDVEYDFNSQEVLITDQGNNRIIKVNSQADSVIWQYDIGLDLPTDADFLPNGNILICDKNNKRLIEVNHNKQIVWQLQSELENLNDADRLSDNKHLVITNGQPSRIGYITRQFISEPRYLGRAVGFDSLFWYANTIPGLTSVQFQLRSENTLGDLVSASWEGPTETTPFYTSSGYPINPVHNGHRFYQFKATLQTSDPLYTPVLNNVKVTYKYYDTEKTGQITSDVINDLNEYIITKWKSLKFSTILPPNPANRDKVEIKISILDTNKTTLRSFIASKVDPTNDFALENIEILKQTQSIQLQANLSTISTAATPILKSWEVIWEATRLTNAKINFVDKDLNPIPYYRVPGSGQDYIDFVTVLLNDSNLVPIQNIVNLNVTSLVSQDTEKVNLSLQPEGWYLLKPSLPVLISDTVIINDGVFQVFDRDSLIVTYKDPMNAADSARAAVLIVQDTQGIIQFLVQDDEGIIQIEDNYYTQIDSASIEDTIYVHIMGEKDQDLNPQQDKVSIVLSDYKTRDQESLLLDEVPDNSGRYETGEFFSTTPLPLVFSATEFGIKNDGQIQTVGGSRIEITYDNSISELPVLHVRSMNDSIVPPQFIRPFDFDIAPNPYKSNAHNLLRIRVFSSIGNLIVEKIEIFNFAGQKIRDIDGSQLTFSPDYPIDINKYSYADSWWNLNDQNATPVSSGTYWIKVIGKNVNTNRRLSHIKKLIIIR